MSKNAQYILFTGIGLILIVGSYFLFWKSDKDDAKAVDNEENNNTDDDVINSFKKPILTFENTVFVPEIDGQNIDPNSQTLNRT